VTLPASAEYRNRWKVYVLRTVEVGLLRAATAASRSYPIASGLTRFMVDNEPLLPISSLTEELVHAR
jgi:hypothetical protein